MKKHRAFPFVMAALTILFLASVAHADSLGITLTETTLMGEAGSTLTFDATLVNLSSTDTVFLNGDSFATSASFLYVDDSPFFANAPFWLDPGQSSGPFALFNVAIDPSAPLGTYAFNTFSILGGADGNASDTIGTTDFTVKVVPEPGTLVLLLSGLAAIRKVRAVSSRR